VVFLVPATVITLFSPPIVSSDSWMHVIVELLAWTAFAAGASFRFWATLYIGGRKERDLVTDGPYSLCRHPLYLGSLLLAISAGLFLESPLFLVATAVVGIVYATGTIPVEERALRSRHGVRFDGYVDDVPPLLPRTCAVRSPSQISVDVHRLWLECTRASRWMWLPILGTAFSHLRVQAWWPRLFHGF
jgi:protein-S-isoprenylcysteine O-methyltransferase Ste14